MSFLNLMFFHDHETETVMRVVRSWCGRNNVTLESDRGREALSVASLLAASGIRSAPHLEEELTTRMRRRD
jgi:hypothetical protein